MIAALWLALKASRPLQIGVALLAGMISWHSWKAAHDAGVRQETLAHVEKKSTEAANKAAKAREAAKRPGAADRLRMRYGETGQ